MTTTTDARIEFDGSEVVTPGLRGTARRWVFWVVIGILLILIAGIGVASTGVSPSKTRLSATNPAPNGAEALVSVLRNDGVSVAAPRTLAAATRDARLSPDTTTLVLYDPGSILDDQQVQSLHTLATNLVLILPNSRALDELAPSVAHAGVVATGATADCAYRPVQRAGSVYGLQQGYRILTRTLDEQGCLGSRGVYSLVRITDVNQTVTVLGGTTLLTNQSIALRGNAALALGLFGATKHLVWYLPSFADAPNVQQDGIIPNPPWVQLSIVLAFLVLLATIVWRGRRLGPVVVENLPVAVRSSETLEGRARLYQRASARGHALDSLRIGTIGRLASLCGLPTRAPLDEVIAAVSALTRWDAAAVRAVLVDEMPNTDRELIHLSDELLRLESDLLRAVSPA